MSASPERREQGDAATTRVDISGDGRFVVFETRARNFFADNDPEPPGAFREGGVFRRDLVTGALELVAYGDVKPTAGGPFTLGARNPSISDDGRWVAFSTAAQLTRRRHEHEGRRVRPRHDAGRSAIRLPTS